MSKSRSIILVSSLAFLVVVGCKKEEPKRQEQETTPKTQAESPAASVTFPAKEIRIAIQAIPISDKTYIMSIASIHITKTDELEFPYAIEVTINRTRRAFFEQTAPPQLVYTFHVNSSLTLSDSYRVRGEPTEEDTKGVAQAIESALSAVKSSR